MRDIALLLLFSAAPAAAQVHPVPVEAGQAPLARPEAPPRSISVQSPFAAPQLGLGLGAPLPVLAPAPTAASAAAPVSRARAVPLAVLLPAPGAAPLAAAHDRDGLSPRGFSPETRASAEDAQGRLDALFDGAPESPKTPPAVKDGSTDAAKPRTPLLQTKGWKRAVRTIAITVPVAAVAAALGAASPPLALAALHALGQTAYWLANPCAFLLTIPQIHLILKRRSASVSTAMLVVGLAATLITTVNFAFDSKDLMMYRNLAQALGFATMLGLQARFSRASVPRPPSRRRALIETGGVVLLLTALLPFIGPVLLAALPGVALMHSLLVPFQIVSGFGFTFMMYAQLSKMRRERSAGDSSSAMMWAYLGTKAIWVWSLATMLSLTAASPWLTLPAGILFAGVCWALGRVALARVLKARWAFLPESVNFLGRVLKRTTLEDLSAFVVLSALILAFSGAGYLLFASLLGIPAAMTPHFVMYLLYSVQSLVACLATLKTLRLGSHLDRHV